jgi:hypothetical protein
MVTAIEEALTTPPTDPSEAAAAIRALIDKAIIWPRADAEDGAKIEVHGQLAGILCRQAGWG